MDARMLLYWTSVGCIDNLLLNRFVMFFMAHHLEALENTESSKI